MSVHVHRSERTDSLLVGLADVLGEVPADPFAPEVVAVPTPGIERFIAQGLGLHLGTTGKRSDGVCANVTFPSPAAVVSRVISQATGVTPAADPWLAHRGVWPLLAVIDRSAGEPWCQPLARHLGLDGTAAGRERERQDRRFAVAARLTALFSSYASQRPGMLLAWAAGRDTDGAGDALPVDLAWQPQLWRRLRDEIGAPSPAERLARACAEVVADPGVVDLPARVSVFGPSRLPADHLQVLSALGTAREVHLWLADASPVLWDAAGDVGSRAEARVPDPAAPAPRRRDASAGAARHPLLRSLGRDSRELRARIARQTHNPAMTDEYVPAPLTADSVLGHLQRQIRGNLDPWAVSRADAPLTLAGDDRSIQVHSCHGQPRQAEVAREVVLGLLASDEALEPRDILIMCPDLDAFAPLLSAAFSGPEGGVGRTGSATDSLRLRIADRTPEQANTVLGGLSALLQMVTGRIELSTLLDFAARAPVRARFGFDDDAIDRLEVLATQAGVRWGLDPGHRSDFHLAVPAGTWAWGLDRLLLGAAMSEEGLPQVGGVLPVDDVPSGDVDLVGRLAELVTRLQHVRAAMHGDHPVGDWVQILASAVTDLMAARGGDGWQLPNALGAITALTDSADGYADTVDLSLADVRWLLDGLLAGRPTRSNFRSGGLTVCGLVPMRSVPHRVICLVGMDDGAFPRATAPDGDDVLARDPLLGERDTRSEDRQLFLDAIMAATDHLVITYTGADDRTNEERPPCVPLGELLDTLDSMAVTGDGRPARAQVRVAHPLQPFDARNFTPGELGDPGPFSHDLPALAAARTAGLPRQPAPPFLAGDLPELAITELSLRDLGSFLASPPAAFLRSRIGVSLLGEDDPASERIPITLDGLARWAIGDRSLDLLVRGAPVTEVAQAERLRGQLPPGALGTEVLAGIGHEVVGLADQVTSLRSGAPRQVSVAIDLPGGVRLVGTVPDVYGSSIVRATYSKSKANHELRLWPEVLAAAVAVPDRGWTARLVTKDGGIALAAPAPGDCEQILTDLVALYRAGMVSPLPLTAATGLAYAERRARSNSVSVAARGAQYAAWQQRFSPDRELPEVVMLWGPDPDLSVLLAEEPRPGEDWYPDEPTRFGMLARRVWDPILAARVGAP